MVRRGGEEIVAMSWILTALDNAALSPPAPERYEWENRRVDEATLQWSPQGGEVLYDGGGDLFLITIPDGEWRQLVKTPAAEHDPKFSPDGKRVAFRRNWDLYVLNVADGRETRLTSDGSDTLRNGGLDWVYPEELEFGNRLLVGARFERDRVSAIQCERRTVVSARRFAGIARGAGAAALSAGGGEECGSLGWA